MTGTTPYMIRAIHEWCTDQGFTPYMLVDATLDGVVVPMNLVSDGTIVMNLDYSAVHHLEMGNEWVLFSARFNGKSKDINIPVAAVRAIYAKENGQGCVFPEVVETDNLYAEKKSDPKPKKSKPDLVPTRRVKPTLSTAPTTPAAKLQSVTKSKSAKNKKDGDKPSLKLVD